MQLFLFIYFKPTNILILKVSTLQASFSENFYSPDDPFLFDVFYMYCK